MRWQRFEPRMQSRAMREASGEELVVTVNGHHLAVGDSGLIERGVRAALRSEGVLAGEVSVTLLDDGQIQELNSSYLGRPHPTDVIAFSLGGDADVLGDVYIGRDQAARQASDLGETLETELLRLAIHGTLHVLGYDHPEGAERIESSMFVLQERLVSEVLTAN